MTARAKVVIHTDGACSGNPGPGGWGAILESGAHRKELKGGSNVAAAKVIGKKIAERTRAAGIEQVVFDRGGYMYHGRVEALAAAAREAGLKF